MKMLVGLIGAFLILLAWLAEARKSMGRKTEDADLRLLAVYLAGSLVLAYYAIQQKDWAFIFLAVALSFLNLIEMVFVFIRKTR